MDRGMKDDKLICSDRVPDGATACQNTPVFQVLCEMQGHGLIFGGTDRAATLVKDGAKPHMRSPVQGSDPGRGWRKPLVDF